MHRGQQSCFTWAPFWALLLLALLIPTSAALRQGDEEVLEDPWERRALEVANATTLEVGNTTSNVVFAPGSIFRLGMNKNVCFTRTEGERCYDLYIPKKMVIENPALVVNLHAQRSENVAQQFASQLRKYADANLTFIVAWPNGTEGAWNIPGLGYGVPFTENVDDLGFIKEMIDQIKNNVIINARKVYATGFSNGGALAYYMAYRAPDYFAAVTSMAYGFNEVLKQDAIQVRDAANSNFRPVPVLTINGYNDQLNCWHYMCLFSALLDLSHNTLGSKRGWHNLATVNQCTGEPETIDHGSFTADFYNDYKWIKAYRNCPGGVEVWQILNSRSHGGEWLGTSFWLTQGDYKKKMIDFLSRFAIPETTAVNEPDWWNAAPV